MAKMNPMKPMASRACLAPASALCLFFAFVSCGQSGIPGGGPGGAGSGGNLGGGGAASMGGTGGTGGSMPTAGTGGTTSTGVGGAIATGGTTSTTGGGGLGDRTSSGGTGATSAPGGAGGTAAPGGSAGASYRVPFDWNGIVGNGQSLSVGSRGTPVISTAQPFHNVKLFDATGTYALDSSGTLSLVPLVEPIRPICPQTSSKYPCSIYGETPHTALSVELTTRAKAAGASDYVTLHSVVGQGAQPLAVIDKAAANGGNAYAATLSEARSFKRFASAAGKTFGYVAIIFTHGETDNGNPGPYESGVYQLYQDYNQDLRAITGQTQPIVLIASQQVSSPPNGNGLANTPLTGTALSLWQAGIDHPGQIVVSGPKYQYRYFETNSTGPVTDPHLYAAGYRRLGEKYAEIIDTIVNRGLPWQPLQPTSAALSGTALTIGFHVPDPPLAWETSLTVATTVNAWRNGRGFEVVDSSGPLTINDARISGDSVVLTLATPPTGRSLRVRYAAYNGCAVNCGDHLLGQLRDSDPFIGADAQTIACIVTTGSAAITCPAISGQALPLTTREVHDLVTGSGFAANAVILSTDKGTRATLSSPWLGASGTANITITTDQRNYAVQFDMAVP